MSKGMIMALYFFLFSNSDKILKRWNYQLEFLSFIIDYFCI